MRKNAELTPRQEEIAELLVWGKAKKEVADRKGYESYTRKT